jgi:hypothetical protein
MLVAAGQPRGSFQVGRESVEKARELVVVEAHAFGQLPQEGTEFFTRQHTDARNLASSTSISPSCFR